MVGHPWCGGCWRRFVDVLDRRRTRFSPLARPGRRWPLALRAAARAFERHRARQVPDSLAVGEPQHGVPAFVARVIAAHIDEFGRYPMNRGLDDFCQAAASWLGRRFALPRPINPASEILVLNGSREGLFLAAIAAARWVGDRRGRPAMLIPNPFYAAYAAGAVAANCEPVYLPATAATGFLPDLDALSEELLARTVAFFIASPANPQGAVADLVYLTRVVALARRFGFLVFSDECYSEIYTRRAPTGMLE